MAGAMSLDHFTTTVRDVSGKILGKIQQSTTWQTRTIPVCWEAPEARHSIERAWVQDAVTNSWQKHSALRFVEWDSCANGDPGIHILVKDIRPMTDGLGRELDGRRDGMVLNFELQQTKIDCRSKELCIRAIAVHEFGQRIGFVHEDYNSGAPDICVINADGPRGDKPLTPYDPDSVMNYCNPRYGNDGQLSAKDIASVVQIYP